MAQIIPLESAAAERRHAVAPERSRAAVRTDAVYVVFTSIDDTLAAVRVAHDFANAMAVPLTLIHLRVVPYSLPVDEPTGVSPVETVGFVGRLRAEGFNLRVRVCLCRGERRAIPGAFKPHSLIVMAGRRSWWPTRTERWRRALEAAGHFVVFVDGSEDKERSDA